MGEFSIKITEIEEVSPYIDGLVHEKNKFNIVDQANRDLIAAIIHKAYLDKATDFISIHNKLFIFYCSLIDLNPHLVATNLRKEIKKRKFIRE